MNGMSRPAKPDLLLRLYNSKSSVEILELVLLILYAGCLSFGAWLAHPVWDDGWLVLLQSSGTPVWQYMADRPLVGAIWTFLTTHQVFWSVSLLLHWLTWVSMGLITSWLFSFSFPGLRQFSLLAALLAITPFICRTQLIIATTMLTAHVSVVLVYGASIALVRVLSADSSTCARVLIFCSASTLVLVAAVLCEYGVVAVLACGPILWLAMCRRGFSLRFRGFTICLLAATTILGYAIYWKTASPEARPEVRPEHVIGIHGFGQLGRAILHVPLAIYSIVIKSGAAVFHHLGDLRARQFFVATLFAAIGAYTFYLKGRDRAKVRDSKRLSFVIACLFLSVFLGLIPVQLFGRYTFDGADSRFLLPIIPTLSCLAVYAYAAVLRKRFHVLATFSLILMFCYALGGEISREHRAVLQAASWGRDIRNLIPAHGLMVAVFAADGVPFCRSITTADYELTARLTKDWTSSERDRFWAFPSPSYSLEKYESKISWRRLSGDILKANVEDSAIDICIRGVCRKGQIARALFVSTASDGSLRLGQSPTSMSK